MKLLVNAGIFFTFALALAVASGYSIGPLILLAVGLFYWVNPNCTVPLPSSYKLLVLCGIALLISSSLSSIFNIFQWSDLDNPSRLLLACIAAFGIFQASPNQRVVLNSLLVGGVFSVFLATVEYVARDGARVELGNNPIQTGGIAASLAVALLAYLAPVAKKNRYPEQWFVFFSLIGAIMCMIMTGSRGSVVGFLFGSVVATLAVLNCFSLAAVRKAVIACSVTIPAGFAVYLLNERFLNAWIEMNRFIENPTYPSSVGYRLRMWELSLKSFFDHPWIGVGEQGFKVLKSGWIDDRLINNSSEHFSHAHSDIVDILVKKGVLGLCTYIAYVTTLTLMLWRPLKYECRVALAGLAVLWCGVGAGLTQGFISHNSGAVMFYFWPVVLWAISHAGHMRVQEHATKA